MYNGTGNVAVSLSHLGHYLPQSPLRHPSRTARVYLGGNDVTLQTDRFSTCRRVHAKRSTRREFVPLHCACTRPSNGSGGHGAYRELRDRRMSPRPTFPGGVVRQRTLADQSTPGYLANRAAGSVTRLTHAYSIGRCFMVKIGWIYDGWPALGVWSRVDVVMGPLSESCLDPMKSFFLAH